MYVLSVYTLLLYFASLEILILLMDLNYILLVILFCAISFAVALMLLLVFNLILCKYDLCYQLDHANCLVSKKIHF